MKKSYAFVVSFAAISLLVSSAGAQQEIPRYSFSAHPSQDGRCQGDTGHGDTDRSEAACLVELPAIASRQGDALRITLQNGGNKIYANRRTGCQGGDFEDCVEYKLTGYFPKHALALIEVSYYEGVEWILLRLDTGKETKVVVPPHYSPHQKWLVAACWSDGPAGCENGVDIVPTQSDQAASEWHYRVPPEDYTLYEFSGWDGDARVKLAVTFHVGKDLKTFPASVDLVAGRWLLKLPREHRSVTSAKSEKPR